MSEELRMQASVNNVLTVEERVGGNGATDRKDRGLAVSVFGLCMGSVCELLPEMKKLLVSSKGFREGCGGVRRRRLQEALDGPQAKRVTGGRHQKPEDE